MEHISTHFQRNSKNVQILLELNIFLVVCLIEGQSINNFNAWILVISVKSAFINFFFVINN